MEKMIVQLTESELKALIREVIQEFDIAFNVSKKKEEVRYLTRYETAALLHVGLVTLNTYRLKSILIPKVIGKRVLYLQSDVERVLQYTQAGHRKRFKYDKN